MCSWTPSAVARASVPASPPSSSGSHPFPEQSFSRCSTTGIPVSASGVRRCFGPTPSSAREPSSRSRGTPTRTYVPPPSRHLERGAERRSAPLSSRVSTTASGSSACMPHAPPATSSGRMLRRPSSGSSPTSAGGSARPPRTRFVGWASTLFPHCSRSWPTTILSRGTAQPRCCRTSASSTSSRSTIPRSPLLERIYEAGGERYRVAAEERRRGHSGRGSPSGMTTALDRRRPRVLRLPAAGQSRRGAFLVIGAFENAVRKHDAESNDFATLESSRFTIPVSVIVAAYDEEVVIESTIEVAARVRLPGVRGRRRQRRLLGRHARANTGGVRPRSVRDVRPPDLHDAARAGDLSEPAARESRRRRQGERRQGGLMERGAQCRPLSLCLRCRRGHGVRPEGASHGDARGDQRSRADRRRDEPDHDRARPGSASSPRPSARDESTAVCSASTSISTSSAPFSTTVWRGRGSASCCARRAASRSGDATFSRRSVATRRLHVRGHRAHVPHPRAVPARRSRLRDPLPSGQRRRDRGAGRRREARVAARALAARHQRDRRPLPAHVVQPSVRVGRHGRRAVLPADGGSFAGDRAARPGVARGGGLPRDLRHSGVPRRSWPPWPS